MDKLRYKEKLIYSLALQEGKFGNSPLLPQITSLLPDMVYPLEQVIVYFLPTPIVAVSGDTLPLFIVGLLHVAESVFTLNIQYF